MATVTKPIALDESLHTTEQTPRNLADVLAQALQMLNTTISGLNFINCVVVQTLPTTDISTTTIYLVPKNPSQTDNLYDEYINLTGTSVGWEKIGDTEIDLSNYYTKTETDTLLSAKADTSDIPTVNDGTLTIQQNGETKGTFTANQSGNSTVNIETPTTDIQTAVDEFETYNGGLLSECKVSLSPNQDLHGYDHSWVGGAGKNKLLMKVDGIKSANTSGTWSGNVYTQNNMTFEIVTDSADNVYGIKINGTNSSSGENVFFIQNRHTSNFVLPADSYYINGMPQNAPSNASLMRFQATRNGELATLAITTVYGSGTLGNVQNGDALQVTINILGNATVNNLVYQPMLRKSTETDYTFEPYSNICPISGHTQVEVENHQKNLLSGLEQGSLDTYGGTNPSTTRIRTKEFIKVDSATAYTFSSESSIQIYMLEFDEIGNERINSPSWVDLPVTFTTQPTTKYFKAMFRYSNNADITPSDAKNCQLELGSTTTPYVPYNGYQITVNLGGTYYSGVLNVVSGVLTVDKVGKDMTTITDWNINTSAQRIYKVLSDIKPTSSGTEIPNLISNRFKALSVNDIYSYVQGVAVSTGSALQFHINGLTDRNDVTLAEVNQWFVDNPTLVVYELATPLTIQLSPTMVKALVGENHLSAPLDGQEITESKYKQMFTFDDVIAYIQSLS